LSNAEADQLARVLVTPQRLPNPKLVGKSAMIVAEQAGIKVPDGTRVLIAELTGVGRDFPLSIEKLCPVLSSYVVRDWREGCERSMQILRYGGMGHTMAIHSEDEKIILEFGLKKPAFRICVNTPTTHGSIGLTTGLDPAMTLGCGGWGGNITSDNISPKHLLNIKRLAWGIRPAKTGSVGSRGSVGSVGSQSGSAGSQPGSPSSLPRVAAKAEARGISAADLTARIDSFLASRGIQAPASSAGPASSGSPALPTSPGLPALPASVPDFVCEADVREAMAQKRKIVLGERTIVTPAARDLGDANKIFVQAGWRM
jgi:acetaldehyde dehydrogenase (acetylating)